MKRAAEASDFANELFLMFLWGKSTPWCTDGFIRDVGALPTLQLVWSKYLLWKKEL